jgi:hypothetical protein
VADVIPMPQAVFEDIVFKAINEVTITSLERLMAAYKVNTTCLFDF